MPVTNARETHTAASRDTTAQAAWSGRLDMAEKSRPGGLLTAALMQSAAERGLSLSELAQALGVSYWSLSQLRVGFRPVEALSEDLLQACSAFLGLPTLTIERLAGLLDAEELLASEALTPADLLHWHQMNPPDPADWVLQPPTNPARPFQDWSVEDLASLHQSHGDKPVVWQALNAELEHRPFSKIERLRTRLRADARSPRGHAASAILSCVTCGKRLRIPHLALASEIRCPHCQTEYAVHWQAAVCLVQPLPAQPSADPAPDTEPELPEEASPWGVLGLPPNSPWEQVERARRSLLQQYHPDRLGHVSPLVRQLAEAAFKRVNDAFETLKASR